MRKRPPDGSRSANGRTARASRSWNAGPNSMPSPPSPSSPRNTRRPTGAPRGPPTWTGSVTWNLASCARFHVTEPGGARSADGELGPADLLGRAGFDERGELVEGAGRLAVGIG